MVLLYQYAFHILAFFLEDSRREDEKHFDIQGEGVIKTRSTAPAAGIPSGEKCMRHQHQKVHLPRVPGSNVSRRSSHAATLIQSSALRRVPDQCRDFLPNLPTRQHMTLLNATHPPTKKCKCVLRLTGVPRWGSAWYNGMIYLTEKRLLVILELVGIPIYLDGRES
jgi:hypothetical protein